MTDILDFKVASSEQIEQHLGARLDTIRLSRNLTQLQLAKAAGVSRSTVSRLGQADKGISLDSFVRIMQALSLEDQLDAMLQTDLVSPLNMLEQQGKARQRARPDKSTNGSAGGWQWDDEEGG